MDSLPLFPFVRRGAWAGTGPYPPFLFLAEQGENIAPIAPTARLQAVAPVHLDAHDEVGGSGGAEDPLVRKESQDQHGERAGDVQRNPHAPASLPGPPLESYGLPRRLGASSSNLARTPRDSTGDVEYTPRAVRILSLNGMMGIPLSPWP